MDVLLRMRPFVGMGTTLLDGVVVEKHGLVAAGVLLTQNTRIPSGEAHAAENAKPLNAIEFEKGLRKRYAQKDEEYDSMLGIVEYIRVDFSSSFLREGGKTLDAITLV
ncbi:hypothetical protein Bca4012_062094 [Brassica carinata]|uniref:Uncharacterized protein n=1 Tax=Brassica carinata TaxID=52824 RepID=A0A8X7SD89_BRACI|nr:hypothetical protein Bca52824_031976 [Brassica carinata]